MFETVFGKLTAVPPFAEHPKLDGHEKTADGNGHTTFKVSLYRGNVLDCRDVSAHIMAADCPHMTR